MDELKQITELTVYRPLWNRGHGHDAAALLNGNGLCCLGFACLAAGLGAKAIRWHSMPADTTHHGIPLFSEERGDTYLSAAASNINDSINLTDDEREARLRELFAEHGVKLSFSDDAPEWLRELVPSE